MDLSKACEPPNQDKKAPNFCLDVFLSVLYLRLRNFPAAARLLTLNNSLIIKKNISVINLILFGSSSCSSSLGVLSIDDLIPSFFLNLLRPIRTFGFKPMSTVFFCLSSLNFSLLTASKLVMFSFPETFKANKLCSCYYLWS